MFLYVARDERARHHHAQLAAAGIFEGGSRKLASNPAPTQRRRYLCVGYHEIATVRVSVLDKCQVPVDPRFKPMGGLVVFNFYAFGFLLHYVVLPFPASASRSPNRF